MGETSSSACLSSDDERLSPHGSRVGARDAGDPILSMLEAGVLDVDSEVRSHSINALNRLEFEVNFLKATKQPTTTDHTRYPPLRVTLLSLLNHPDAAFRWGVVGALSNTPAPAPDVENALLSAYRIESNGRVKAHMIRGLGRFAARGSPESTRVLQSALDDNDVGVQIDAIGAFRRLPSSVASGAFRHLPVSAIIDVLIEKLGSDHPWVRRTAANVLATYGAAVAPHKEVIERQFSRETDAETLYGAEETTKFLGTVALFVHLASFVC